MIILQNIWNTITGVREQVEKTLEECGFERRSWSVSVTGNTITMTTLSGPADITFAMLEKASIAFQTKNINCGGENGYYGSIYSKVVIEGAVWG